MSILNKTNWSAKYGTSGSEFPDNTTGLITELIMRTFGNDLKESFLSLVDDLQKKTTATGTNTYAITGGIYAYADGFSVIVKFTNASSGVCTLNVNSKGAKKIFTNPTIQATTGDITALQTYLLVYDSALDTGTGGFALIGGSGGGGGGTVLSVTGPNVDNTDPTNPITGTIELTVRKTTDYILAASDAGKLIEMDVAVPNTIIFPLDATVPIPINSIGTFVSRDAATSIVKEDPGIIINSSSGTLDFPTDPFAPVVWKKIDTDEWYLYNGSPESGGTAATTTFTPAGDISATDVQAAIEELDSEKLPTSYLDTDGTLAANSDVKIASQKAVRTYIANAVAGLLDLKGDTDASTNPNYPSALKGDAYYTTVPGKIGGASGKNLDIGDVYVAKADNAGGTEASVGTSWFVLEHNLAGVLLLSGGTMAGNIAMATFKVTGLGAATTNGDAVRYEQITSLLTTVATDGTLSGDGTLGNPLSVVTTGFVIASNNGSDFSSASTTRQNLRVSADILTITAFNGNRTLAATDFPILNGGKSVEFECTDTVPQTITVPPNATVPLDIGSIVYGRVMGTSTVTIAAGAGVTIQSTSGTLIAPAKPFLWSLTKDAADHWIFDNSGLALGTANQILGVDNAGTAQEYKTVSQGLTSASGTLKAGGPLTADINFSGAFSFGIGVAPSAKFHVVGLGTTTGELIRLADSTTTTRWSMLDNGSSTWTTAVSGASVIGNTWNTTVTATANSQTQTGFLYNMVTVDGGFTGLTRNAFEVTLNSSATRLFSIGTVSLTTNGLSTIDFKTSGDQTVRNSTGALFLKGGSGSTTCIKFGIVSASSTNNNIFMNLTGTWHNLATGLTRTLNGIVDDHAVTSVDGSTITYNLFNQITSFSVGNSTLTIQGFTHDPQITGTGTITNYAFRAITGLSGFGIATPTARLQARGLNNAVAFLAEDDAGNAIASFGESGGARVIGLFGATPAVQQTSGANLINNVTSGGTDNTIDDFTNLTVYATDAGAIRNAIYQLSRKLKQVNDGLRTLGAFT